MANPHHHHGHAHPHRSPRAPAARLGAPTMSLLRLSAPVRLAFAGIMSLALWLGVLAVMG